MVPPPAASRVVAAVSPLVARRIRAILPECELRFVHTRAQLASALDEARCDMLIVGMHFDESSAVAALERVLSRGAAFPVVCVRGVAFRRLGQPAFSALRTALDALGARNFIDLLEYPDDASGNAHVRAMLERFMSRD